MAHALYDEGAMVGVSGMVGGSSGSLMAEMNALFAPPGRSGSSSYGNGGGNSILNPRPVELHPYFKRPGKGHNHDCCDACGEGGDLICCDNCPASFHFSCHAPPLEEEDIPKGDWVCLRCYVRDKSRMDVIRASSRIGWTSTIAEAPTTEASEPGDGTNGQQAQDPSSSTSTATRPKGRTLRNSTIRKQAEAALKAEKEKKVKLYKLKYDRYLKPKELTGSPFDALIAATQVVNAHEFQLPRELEVKEDLPFSWKWSDERQDDFDQYPKKCTSCRKTSRNIPSIACDFCPCVFHLDCLDPPLCEVPKERWMCPNHVENFLDSNLVTSTSLTERMRLWDKYARSKIDPEAIKLDFLRKARSGKFFQRCNMKTPLERRVQVPQNIKDQYKLPLPGYAQDSNIRPFRTQRNEGSNEEFLSQLVSLQTSVLRHQAKRKSKMDGEKSRKACKVEKEEGKGTGKAELHGSGVEQVGDAEKTNHLAEKTDSDINKNDCSSKLEEGTAVQSTSKDSPSDDETASNCSIDLEDVLSDGSEDEDPPTVSTLSQGTLDQLCEYLAKRKNQGLKNLHPTVRNFLAMQKMKDLLPTQKKKDLDNEVRARAALLPINISKTAIPMKFRTLSVGLGATHDVDLSQFGHCNYVSHQHACIFFDQFSQVYELLNYSEHGSIVDNTVYCLNTRPLVQTKLKQGSRLPVMNGSRRPVKSCYCETSIAKMIRDGKGCENSAILHHGSYIRMGCLQFVFSLADDIHTNEREEKVNVRAVEG